RQSFIYDMVGNVSRLAAGLSRSAPEKHPDRPSFVCMEAWLIEHYGNVQATASQTIPGIGWMQADFARYRLVYRQPPYVTSAGDDGPFPNELIRYVERKRKQSGDNQQVPSGGMFYQPGGDPAWTGQLVSQNPVFPWGTEFLEYRWVRVPIPSIPWAT